MVVKGLNSLEWDILGFGPGVKLQVIHKFVLKRAQILPSDTVS